MKVAFLGLGSMGRPMAANLAGAGHDVTLWNRTAEKAETLAAETGAAVAGTPAAAAEGAEVAVTMLSDDGAVEAVVPGPDGLAEGLGEGAVHASMSTTSVGLARRLEAAHAERGQRFVAAPVFGRPDMAEAAALRVVASGRAGALEAARPVLEAVGQGVVELGDDVEKAAVVKLAGNFLLASAIESMGEAFALVRKHGVDPGDFLDVANGKVIDSPVYEGYGGLIVDGAYEPAGFALKHGLKDVRYGLEAGDDAAVPMPVASAVRDRFLTAMARGWEELDWAALGKVAADAAGLR